MNSEKGRLFIKILPELVVFGEYRMLALKFLLE
jgi:hypothetical protein